MTYRRGQQSFRSGVDRLFEHVDQFIIHQTMFCIGALWASRALSYSFDHDDTAVIDSAAFPLSLEIPLAGVAEAAFAEQQAETRTITVHEGRKAPGVPNHLPFTRGLNNVLWLPITPIFVDFYERNRPWAEQTYEGNGGQKSWPPNFYFMRLIRNAVSHGGKLYMTHDPRRDAEWHHLKFGYSDNGTQVIGPGGVLSPADLLFLMIDASDELDKIGCPS